MLKDVSPVNMVSFYYKLISTITSTLETSIVESEQGREKNVADHDKLKQDAERAITRNIDKLSDIISSSESMFQEIVLGSAAKELINISFKNRLLSTSTTKDTQTKAAEFLSHIETWVSINPSLLDVFLTVLISKCGKIAEDVAESTAKECKYKLYMTIQYVYTCN
jgi:hypothetical protein